MAFQLFVDPSEGTRAYARGIEKAGDAIGDAVGGILKSHNEHRAKKEASLNLLAANDIDGFKKQKEYLVQQNDKDKQQALLGHYERKYETLAAMEGALKGYAIERENETRMLDHAFKTTALEKAKLDLANAPEDRRRLLARDKQQRKLVQGQIRQQKLKNDQITSASAQIKEVLNNQGNGSDLGFTGNVLQDEQGPMRKYRKAKTLVEQYPDLPQSSALRSYISEIENSPNFTRHNVKNKSGALTYNKLSSEAVYYNHYFAGDMFTGNAEPIDNDSLMTESYNNEIGNETNKVRMGNFAKTQSEYLAQSVAPGLMLDAMGVPSLRQIKSENRLPTIDEVKAMENFDERYRAGDLSLFAGITDTRAVMQLSAMNLDNNGKPVQLSENDEDLIASLLNSSRGIKDVLSMLGSKEHGKYIIKGKEIDVSETNKLRTQWEGLKEFLSPSGEKQEDLAAFRNQLSMMVTDLARGVFAEVGVLTDADIRRYEKLLADPRTPADTNIILSNMLLDTVRNKADDHFKTLAANGKNVSGFLPAYAELQPRIPMSIDEALKLAREGRIIPGRTISLERPDTGKVYNYQIANPKNLESTLMQMQRDVNESYTPAPENQTNASPSSSDQGNASYDSQTESSYASPDQQQSSAQTNNALPDLLNAPGVLFESRPGGGDWFRKNQYQFPNKREQSNLELAFAAEGNNSKDFAGLLSRAKQGDKNSLRQLQDLMRRNKQMNARVTLGSQTPANLFLPKGGAYLNR
ncbi:hypothetical protein N8702_01485 [Verrucomicrobia bacterium]|nr:hypothetical protein [Verrucomicrobiota bacterium]